MYYAHKPANVSIKNEAFVIIIKDWSIFNISRIMGYPDELVDYCVYATEISQRECKRSRQGNDTRGLSVHGVEP